MEAKENLVEIEESSEGNAESDQLGCEHYFRKCCLIAPCCKKEYICRVCHDEKELHEMDRRKVTTIKCLKCDTLQEVRSKCKKCGIVFGNYFCEICRLFDDKDKEQFHCDRCGICRIGGAENFFHCEKCDVCLGNTLKDNHKCIEKVSHDVCSICREDLHTSRTELNVPPCGHILHRTCYLSLLKTGNYACPTCNESMVKMDNLWKYMDEEISGTEMPDEYKDLLVPVLCRDCHKISS
ncbi:RING finger and CHY zinc finger domain-containing protein 1-like isoform X2 [Gigantopelta aegis]|uniref:RING finger and CHY zinc finger domain-containing protein 1-like isoform X2 n=1 Tax=Gigantopelta aegis TaxID=1735272 RepID=UPI001B88AC34|nr:RING finger and CHY zinc finger domain-containing protein 1-like isoform X2 [Gigantopelta aegis]